MTSTPLLSSELLSTQLKIAKQRKGEIARQFKSLTQGSPEHQQALTAMQEITKELKVLESQWADIHKPSVQAEHVQKLLPALTLIESSATHTAPFICRTLEEYEWALWDAYVANVSTANTYHYAVWLQIIKEQFGHEGVIWVAFDEQSRIIGGIPLVLLASPIFGRFGVSVPYFNYGGVLSEYFNVAQELLLTIGALCQQFNLRHIEVRCMQEGLLPNGACLSRKSSLILGLPASQSLLEQQLGAKVRAQYKKAFEHSPRFSVGKKELLDQFYTVFAQNMRDLGTPVYSKGWFARLLEEPSLNCHIALVHMYGKPVSAGFLIGHGNMLEIPWASTIRQANSWNANMWMYRQILGYAIEQGYHFFDFGRSTIDAGTFKFKRQWGAEPFTHYWYYLLPEGGQMPGLNPDNPKYKLVINIWKKLPVWLTKIIGPAIVANIP
ncbi:MAG TPA: FemAB family XrtA/PEP-CTERM system-associated protein [Cellvibrionaceae bacterium]